VLDWLGALEEVEAASVLDTAWALSVEGFYAFMIRTVPDFPEHKALRSLLKAPEVSPSARSAWSSAIVNLLRNMPTRHLGLGVDVYQEVKALALRHRDEPLLYENLVRAATNLALDFQSSRQPDQEQRLFKEAEALIDNHPDKERGAEGRGRLLVCRIQVRTKENEAELARPLPPAPITFLHPISRLKNANDEYEELSRLCEMHAENVELRRLQAAAAFDLILGCSAVARASTRVGFPAILLLKDQIEEQVKHGEEIYKGLDSLLSKYPRVASLDLFLGKSASAIIAAHSSLPKLGQPRTIGKSTSFYKQLCELTTAHPGEPELREELARAARNLVLISHDSGRLSEAREFYEKLCALAMEYPNEVNLEEMKKSAAKLLEH
jgi:tetratricopeptide (TPR) repeat protein